MIYDAIKRRDNLIARYVDSQRFMADAMNRQHDTFTKWLRWQIEKREMRQDTINLIGKSGGGDLSAEVARSQGEAPAPSRGSARDDEPDRHLSNRQKSRRAKLGLHWCCGCDANLVGQGERCDVCGHCHNPKKLREPR